MPKSGATATSVSTRALAWGKPRGARAADLSAAAAEQEDGNAQVGYPASQNNETELRKLRNEIQSLKDEIQSLKQGEIQSLKQGEIQSLKDQLNNLSTPSATWGIAGWVDSLALTKVVAEGLKEPAGTDPFEYVCSLSLADLEGKLEAVKLSGLAAPLWSAVEKLRDQSAATGAALNAKFAAEGDAFKGLEKIIGAPLMVEGSLLKAMETEHCKEKDADVPFDTSNGIEGVSSRLEWEFVVAPVIEDGRYAERGGDFRTVHPDWCRKPEPLSVYEAKMADEVNPRLVEAGQAPLTLEELVAGRIYTGPMYEKYNGVLRFFSARDADGAVLLEYASVDEVPFLQKKCGWLHLGEWAATAAGKGEPGAVRWTWHNQYSTTIHAINSIIVKLSPLTRITPLYRGWTGATLPEAFFKPDALGFRGGVEYGFSSTTTDRAQAVQYAAGKASTVLELVMGMIDRGADISWLSQYPHERETLLPPLMGLQVRSTGVEGSTLVVQCSFSISMASLTLEQVAGKRKKLLTDMGSQMAAEVRRGVAEGAAEEALQLVRVHLGLERCADAGGAADKRLEAPLGDEAEEYNSDARFQAAVGDALKVKRAAMLAATMHRGAGGLAAAMNAVLPLQASRVDLTGLDLGSDDGVMVGTMVAWMKSEPSALTSLTLDWGVACGRVREAVLSVVRTTRTLVALSVGEKGAMPLNPLQLTGREALTSLVLSSRGLGPGSAAVVAAGLSVNEVLTSLNMEGNEIGPTGATAIAEALRGNEVLTNLEVRRNEISGDAAQQLATAVLASPSLELFGSVPLKKLRANTLGKRLGLSGKDLGVPEALVLAKLVEGSEVLTKLNLDDCELDLPKLRGTDPATSLDLSNSGFSGLGPAAAVVIASLIAGNGVLKNLYLNNDAIGGEGAKALASALRVNGVLRALCLHGNSIGDAGAVAIAEALRVNGVLTNLNLGWNHIGAQGATAIAEALRGNAVLKTLDLHYNNIGGEGAVAIADALRVNAALTALDLSDNSALCGVRYGRGSYDASGIQALAEALKVNKVLMSIDLRGISLGDEGIWVPSLGRKAIHDAVSGREGFHLYMDARWPSALKLAWEKACDGVQEATLRCLLSLHSTLVSHEHTP
ncbi:hypothetical protein EMIHUDRAFT_231872 [Emiliania huxleyi CCMP1516]|uniref:Mono(ADP-ribosyl)transferase n=2 Tax=Emiliania huxleyi TaxID=2903 RepID=A0A0D3K6U0_EMIH1|nr:hypothetical protein EMIHUDRAFT_231872 [Emiliania huxleyi CCMP1516]EOD31475.1 hypothetical protein EMIHUDRAFT_231872 [Emiliania huxleyi CCMP1516]|eukprot:XP_005783904.1 hypothetical protein EMIHUDRAFT_231872 [Emiliania huxleyi CCMP1516]